MTDQQTVSAFADDTFPADFREQVLLAALDELCKWGVERFSIEAMTQRHDLDKVAIYRCWGDRDTLVLDVLEHWSHSHIAAPDTGSLRGDLLALADAVVAYANNDLGRRLLRGLVMDEHLSCGDTTRLSFWRQRFAMMRAILDRADARGELRDGVSPLASMQILLAPINIRALYTDVPVETEYGAEIADLVWRALVRTD